jgi:rifampicin phosphotransferase
MRSDYLMTQERASSHGEELLGGKARNMAWLTRNGFPVPSWLVVTTAAFEEHLRGAGSAGWVKEVLASARSLGGDAGAAARQVRERIMAAPLAPEIEAALGRALEAAGPAGTFFAVRSSAVGEDAAAASFAGQMDSFLFQKGLEAVSASVVACFASAFTERSVQYRALHGMNPAEAKIAVIVQRMMDCRVSGVFFTAHPVTGSRKHGLISACYGLGEGVVSGSCTADEYTVSLYGNEIKELINDKDATIVFDSISGRGTREMPVPEELRGRSCLSEQEIREITETGRRIAGLARFPQDIEWGYEGNSLCVLQTRPITSLPAPAEPAGDTIVWDNSNIQESYCGVTTPLTFTFASRAYSTVYEQTARVLGVPEKRLEEMKPVFQNLLGLVKGRVYYNINNWYRGLLILPSFTTNKADMERMMGLQDPVDFVEDRRLSLRGKIARAPGMIRTLFRLLSGFRKMDALVADFRARFRAEYEAVDRSRLHTLEMAELIGITDRLRERVMREWQAPIINDFYVMMMNGRVHRWLEKAGAADAASLQNNLMAGEEGIESTEPTKHILRLCDYIRTRPDLLRAVMETEPAALLGVLQGTDPHARDLCAEYIELYGDRCIGELKLESVSLRQDPSFLFAIVKNYLSREDLTVDTLAKNERSFRDTAEAEAFTLARKKLGRRGAGKFRKDLAKLRQAVKNRENMRLMRTRLFGLMRDIYMETGCQLAFHGILGEPRDIFYLTVEEIEAYIDGRSVQSNLKPLVAARREEFASYESEELPHHFTTRGPVYHHNSYQYNYKEETLDDSGILRGIGCYPGKIEEKVKLIFSPKDELNLKGQILCTVRTDPGWAPLFPTAGGILVERGSTLSHSAVVARELGIPAIVNVPGLTRILHDGERVLMDGAAGTIQRLEADAKTTTVA